MRKHISAITLLIFVIISSCTKNNDSRAVNNQQRPAPEGRNQEGTRLLGVLRASNDQVQWSTISYDGSSGRVTKVTDSVMSLVDLNSDPWELAFSIFTYDASGKLSEIISTAHDSVDNYHYSYDVNGHIIEETVAPLAKHLFSYDDHDNIITDSTFDLAADHCVSYSRSAYDGNRNRTLIDEWQYDNNLSALSQTASTTFNYDDKPTPYAVIDPNSFWYRSGPHNTLSMMVHSFATGNTYNVMYTYVYNSFGVPKEMTTHSPSPQPTDVTDKFYYY